MTAYERILDLCDKNGIAQTKLEKELGFSRGSIGKSKQHEMTHSRLQKIADYFEVSVDYLIGATDIPFLVETTSPDTEAYARRLKEYNDRLSQMILDHEYLKSVMPTRSECDLIMAFRNADYRTQRSVLMALGLDEQEEELRAAHERTDIETTKEMKQHDYDIMKGDDF